MSKLFILFFVMIPGLLLFAQSSIPEEEILEFIAVEKKPVISRDAQPVYPDAARQAEIEGTVIITVVVTKNGTVAEAEIFKSIPMLDEAALAAARNMLFTPGSNQGETVNTRMNIPIEFNLSDTEYMPEPESAVTTGPVGDVVDLTGSAVIIKAEPDRPRVNIISDRIKPEFDNINLEKSFVPELLGKAERIVIIKATSEKEVESIDVKNILNRSR